MKNLCRKKNSGSLAGVRPIESGSMPCAASKSNAGGPTRRSKEPIEDRLGFAYAFAVASPGAACAARQLLASAALDAWRTNRRGQIDPDRLGRTPILQSDGGLFFRVKVLGLLDAEALAYRALGRGPWRET